MNQRDRFRNIMATLAELAGRELSTSLCDIYWSVLKEYSDQQVEQAVAAGIKHWDCFTYGRIPSPAEIIAQIHGSLDTEALEAWEQLDLAIRAKGAGCSILFTNAKISRVVVALGGWIEVCKWRTDELPYRRAEFMKLYKATPGSCRQQVLPGLIELDNHARGYLQHIPPAEVIGEGEACLAPAPLIRPEWLGHCVGNGLANAIEPSRAPQEEP